MVSIPSMKDATLGMWNCITGRGNGPPKGGSNKMAQLEQDGTFTSDVRTMAVVLYTPSAIKVPAAVESAAAKAAKGHRDSTGDSNDKSTPGPLSVIVY